MMILSNLASGISLGSVYAIIALGYTMSGRMAIRL